MSLPAVETPPLPLGAKAPTPGLGEVLAGAARIEIQQASAAAHVIARSGRWEGRIADGRLDVPDEDDD